MQGETRLVHLEKFRALASIWCLPIFLPEDSANQPTSAKNSSVHHAAIPTCSSSNSTESLGLAELHRILSRRPVVNLLVHFSARLLSIKVFRSTPE